MKTIEEFNTKEISALKGWIEEYGFKHVNDRGKELVLWALSKQIPMEPNICWDEAGYWSALCPRGCLSTVGEGNSCEDHFKNNFCFCCGQAIDWENEE